MNKYLVYTYSGAEPIEVMADYYDIDTAGFILDFVRVEKEAVGNQDTTKFRTVASFRDWSSVEIDDGT